MTRSMMFPDGHYYSPLPHVPDIIADQARIFRRQTEAECPGICFNTDTQLDLLRELAAYYQDLPFGPRPEQGMRYYYDNPMYSYGDAIFLYSMLRHVKPRRYIEVGSGYSSCVALDTNQRFLDGGLECIFIEPEPQRLYSLLAPNDRAHVKVLPHRVQDTPFEIFEELQENDILFIDSSHVTKIGSDVNFIMFEVLPRLKPGVFIHIHDIGFPFEYPRDWVVNGCAWNEAYLLRAFLMFNSEFRIRLFSSFLAAEHSELLYQLLPLCSKNPGGQIWLQREKCVQPLLSSPSDLSLNP